MFHQHHPMCRATFAACLLCMVSCAFGAPGEDNIVINRKFSTPSGPYSPSPVSSPLDGRTSIPPATRAKLNRYTAKAYSSTADDGSIYSDNDVVTTVEAEGLRKTCVQEVGSSTSGSGNSLGTRYGPAPKDQVVVLRGDLVNLCR